MTISQKVWDALVSGKIVITNTDGMANGIRFVANSIAGFKNGQISEMEFREKFIPVMVERIELEVTVHPETQVRVL